LKEKNIEVILQWVPNYISIEGNEKADKAAKKAAEKSISPEIERYSLFSYITRNIKV
jgi:ribonuclease HI